MLGAAGADASAGQMGARKKKRKGCRHRAGWDFEGDGGRESAAGCPDKAGSGGARPSFLAVPALSGRIEM